MKSAGEKLKEIIEMLEREEAERQDIVTELNSLRMNDDFSFQSDDLGRVDLSDYAFSQLCAQVYGYPLPAEYFKRLYKENPEKATRDLNYHLQNGRNIKRKFRVVGDKVKGIVSQGYATYDNLDAVSIFSRTAKELPEFELSHSFIDDKIMFLRFTFPSTEKNFGKTVDGAEDKNFVALDLVNSEVGYASLLVNPSIYRLVCTNGMVAKQAEYGFFKQRHFNFEHRTVNDNIRKSMIHGVETGTNILDKFGRAREMRIDNPYEWISELGKRKSLSNKLMKEVRTNFEIENEHSLYGVVNAFTRTARDMKSLEKRLELEKYASKILDDRLKVVG